MKLRNWFVPALLALGLSACYLPQQHQRGGVYPDQAEEGRSHRHRSRHEGRAPSGEGDVFVCENGMRVRVKYLGNEQIRLSTEGRSVVMKRAVSASGERYTADSGLFGNGGEWHQKGGEAVFAFTEDQGGDVETSCSSR